MERETKLYHGTVSEVASTILDSGDFNLQQTYFAGTRDLAEFFAKRTNGKRKFVDTPVVISVSIYESVLKTMVNNGYVTISGFDVGDHPALQGKIQYIFNYEAMKILNREMLDEPILID